MEKRRVALKMKSKMMADEILDDTELENLIVEKLNKLLLKYNKGFTFRVCCPESRWSRIEVCGYCLGRRHWDDILQVVNAYSEIYWHSTKLYTLFHGLSSRNCAELLIKIDLAYPNINISE